LIQFFVLLIITNIDELDLVSSNIAEIDGSSFDGPTALQEMIDAIRERTDRYVFDLEKIDFLTF
jgi:hypothetical protein